MIETKSRSLQALNISSAALIVRMVFLLTIISSIGSSVLAQNDIRSIDRHGAVDSHGNATSDNSRKSATVDVPASQHHTTAIVAETSLGQGRNDDSLYLDAGTFEFPAGPDAEIQSSKAFDMRSFLEGDWRKFDREIAAKAPSEPEIDDLEVEPPLSTRFHWGPAIRQMMVMQAIQHSVAIAAQEKTRRGFKGKFFSDYWNSVKGLRGWDDGNRFFTNYVAHPMQGATSGFIFIQNHERASRQKFGESKEYWIDRLKTFAWAAAWSTNWELGPISQASLGNVGLNGGMAYVDLVVTPVVGTAWTVTEEALDRYIIRHTEGKGMTQKILLRCFLNPMRSVANLLRMKRPWYRERQPVY